MDVLRWLRSRRIVRRAADHRSPVGEVPPAVADLLAAAAAPARPAELAGERDAVAAFRREYRRPDPATGVTTRVRSVTATQRPRRPVVVTVLTVTIALVGGTAYAAAAGRLPDPVQRQLHEALADVGVPPPVSRVTPTTTTVPGPASSAVASPPGDPRLLQLCRAWQVARATPGAPQLRPDERRALADAAGGPNRIEGFCAALAGGPTPGGSAPGVPPPGVASPGKPGNPHPGVPPATPPGNGGNGGNGNRGNKGNGPPG